MELYDGLTKAEATALFLLQTEVIGLNVWLPSVFVPDILPRCECGWRAQTVRHILLHCPRFDCQGLVRQAGTENLYEMLQHPASARQTVRWLISQGVMEQFRVAKEVGEEDMGRYAPFSELENWV